VLEKLIITRILSESQPLSKNIQALKSRFSPAAAGGGLNLNDGATKVSKLRSIKSALPESNAKLIG